MSRKKNGWFLAFLCICWGGLYGWYGGQVAGFVFYLLVGLSAYAVLSVFGGLKGLDVRRTLSTRKCVAGDRLEVELTVTCPWRMPWVGVMVYDLYTSPPAAKQQRKGFLVTSRKQVERYVIYQVRRGRYHFHGILCRAGDIFGFGEREGMLPQTETVTVYPRFLPFPSIPLLLREGEQLTAVLSREDASVVTGLRQYQPGDRLQEINWKSSARGQGLKVKKRSDNQAGERVIILLDQRAEVYQGMSEEVFEWGVSAVASLSYACLKERLPVVVAFTGTHPYIMPVDSLDPHFYALMDDLVDIKADGGSQIDAWRELRLPRHATLLAVTPRPDEELQRLLAEWQRHREVMILQWVSQPRREAVDDNSLPTLKVWVDGGEWRVGRRGS
jgi:uncharacterized protein (DUF58 family)